MSGRGPLARLRCGAPLRAALLLSALALSCAPDPPAAPPNIVVIVVDTLRADRLALYGGERASTPFLDELAAESLVFDGAWSTSSWTAPATASLFTSLYPSQHGVLSGLKVTRNRTEGEQRLNRLPGEVETLPEVLRRAGYRTFGVADNPNVCETMGFTRGFDRFAQFDYAGAQTLIDTARAWRGEMEGESPFFLYLHFMDPHGPYHPRAPWFDPTQVEGDTWEQLTAALGREPQALLDAETSEVFEALGIADDGGMARAQALVREAYDSELAWLDERLAEAFTQLPIDAETLVVFTADHGEEFGERGAVGHGYQVFEELVRLPLFLRLPASMRAAQGAYPARIQGNFSLIDVLPTLRAIAGTEPSEQDAGRDLLDPGSTEGRLLLAERYREGGAVTGLKSALREGSLKAVIEEPGGSLELYDLAADPGETRNLAEVRAQDAARLRAAWSELRAGLRKYERAFAEGYLQDEDDRAALERLGYIEPESGESGH